MALQKSALHGPGLAPLVASPPPPPQAKLANARATQTSATTGSGGDIQSGILRLALMDTLPWEATQPNCAASDCPTVPRSFVARHSPSMAFAFRTLSVKSTVEVERVSPQWPLKNPWYVPVYVLPSCFSKAWPLS